mgnify:CR=1 FL=1
MPAKPPADARALHVPATRTWQCWSRALLEVTEIQADIGQIRLASDLCEKLIGDDRIQGVLRPLVQSIFGLTPTFEATSGDGRRRGRVGRALEQGEDWWQLCPVAESSLFMIWGILLGVAPGRLEWWQDQPAPSPFSSVSTSAPQQARMHQGRLVPVIRFWHPRHLRLDESGVWMARLRNGSEEPVTPGRNGWLLFTPYGTTRPWSTAPWRGAAEWWLMKHRAMEYWERHAEKGAHLFIESSELANPEERKNIAQGMADAGQDAVTVAPFGYKGNLLEGKATGDLYDRLVAAANAAFAVLLSGHANNAEVKDANTGATVGQDMHFKLVSGLAEAWSEFVHDQVLAPYAEVNFGDPELAQWPTYPIPKPDEMAQRGAGLKAIGEGVQALQGASDRVDSDKLLEDHKIPLLTEAEAAARRQKKAEQAPPVPAQAPASDPTPTEDATDGH